MTKAELCEKVKKEFDYIKGEYSQLFRDVEENRTISDALRTREKILHRELYNFYVDQNLLDRQEWIRHMIMNLSKNAQSKLPEELEEIEIRIKKQIDNKQAYFKRVNTN